MAPSNVPNETAPFNVERGMYLETSKVREPSPPGPYFNGWRMWSSWWICTLSRRLAPVPWGWADYRVEVFSWLLSGRYIFYVTRLPF